MRVGVVGYGVMGRNHCRVGRSVPGLEIVAVCDPLLCPVDVPEQVFSTVHDMLAGVELDAAIIASPTSTHEEIALACLEKGLKTLLIEKPVAASVRQGMRILEEAERRGARVAVGHVERFNPVITSLKRELEGKEVLSVQITRVGPFPPRISDVGVLTDLAVHDVDLVRFITGREVREARIFKSSKISGHHEDNALVSMQLEGDVVAGITTNWLTPFKKRMIEAATPDAYFEANLMSQELKEFSAYKVNNSYVVRGCFVRPEEPLKRELEALVRLGSTGEMGDFAGLRDAIRTLEVLGL